MSTARPETMAYAHRIEQAAETDPTLLIGHHYTRYLGDLSGGQVLRRVVARTFGLTDGAGGAFYVFPLIPDPAAYKAAYRDRLDRLNLGEPVAGAVVAEAVRAFELNQHLFAALAAAPDTPG